VTTTPAAPLRARSIADRLLRAIATPLIPDDYLDLIAPLRPGAELRGRVVSVHPETPDATTVVIRPGRSWPGHVPGQYVRLGVDVDGVRHWRAYSLTSPRQTAAGNVSITVKAIPDGRVSNHIVRHLRPGALVHMDQPTGDFVLDGHRGPTLFVTAGSGITPVMGILRNHVDQLDDVVLVHSAPTPDDVIFAEQLRSWQDAGSIRLIERHTDRDGIITPDQLDDLVPDWRRREAWLCGPTLMLDAFEDHYAAMGLADRLHTERFRPTVIATGEGGTVTFTRSGTQTQVDGATPLLDAGESAGVLMPSGCRMGICFGCVVPLREGAVRDLRTGDLTTAAPDDDIRIQTCISAAAGPCDIEI
jgi:ferredoxin-NADP reductase